MRHPRVRFFILVVAALGIAALAVGGCSKDPAAPPIEVPETLASLAVTVPDWVRANTAFPITVEAVGNRGGRPLGDVAGTVTLSTQLGTLSPTTLDLTGGTGTVQAMVSNVSGSLAITATMTNAVGTGTILTVSPDSIEGNPLSWVDDLVPEMRYFPRGMDFSNDHPDLSGEYLSFNTILISFVLTTSVGEANRIIDDIGGAIVGGMKGLRNDVEAVVIVRLPTTSHAELTPVIDALKLEPAVAAVTYDVALSAARVTKPNAISQPFDWQWDTTPSGGNWGLELTRVPQMWNLADAVAKSLIHTPVAVMDYGFPDHIDLDYFSSLSPVDDHGAMVAGIIGAIFNNEIGIDGICPFADLVIGEFTPMALSGTRYSALENIQAVRRVVLNNPDLKILALTSCYNWCEAGVDPMSNVAAQEMARAHGEEFKRAMARIRGANREPPLMITAAGNDSDAGCGTVEALFASPWNNAALDNAALNIPEPNMLVIEALENSPSSIGGARRAAFSNTGGSLSAPGVCIRSTADQPPVPPRDSGCDVDGRYKSDSGTSYAVPHVAGVAAFMLTLDPDLTPSNLITLLNDASVVTEDAANRVDAWASVMEIDRFRGSVTALRKMLDIDDGSPDGNQRLDAVGTRINFDLHGDDQVDMADFRRWRDWYLQLEDAPGLDLDGGPHQKKDPNGNAVQESRLVESQFARGDFNGDGKMDLSTVAYVPGTIDADATDLEVFATLFNDPNYDASELVGLLQTGDVTIEPKNCLDPASAEIVANGYEVVASATVSGGQTPTRELIFDRKRPTEVLSLPPGDYQIDLVVRDPISTAVIDQEMTNVSITLGGDSFWFPGTTTSGCVDSVKVKQVVQIPVSGTAGNHGLSNIGDLNHDGVIDLAMVGESPVYDGQRALLFLFLNADGTLKNEKVIELVEFGYDPEGGAPFKTVSGIGDVDKDGNPDVAVGIYDEVDIFGSLRVLLMNSDGTIKSSTFITGDQLNCTACGLGGGTNWIVPVGDLDGDTVVDIAVAWGTDDDGRDRLVILYLKADGTLKSAAEWGWLSTRDNVIAGLGDVDNDGLDDIGYGEDLFFNVAHTSLLSADGSEKSGTDIFSWANSEIMNSMGGAGDMDGDLVPDFLVTTRAPESFASNVWLMLLNNDGSLKSWLAVGHPALGTIWGVTGIGDFDGNGVPDLALLDQDICCDDSVWIIFLEN